MVINKNYKDSAKLNKINNKQWSQYKLIKYFDLKHYNELSIV